MTPGADEGGNREDAADVPTEAIASVDLPTEAISAVDLPTEAISAVDLPTQAIDASELPQAPVPVVAPETELIAGAEPAHPLWPSDDEPTSAIDSLFSETQFQVYEDEPLLLSSQSPSPSRAAGARPASVPSGGSAEHAALTPTQKRIVWGAIAGVAVLALFAVFLLSVRLSTPAASAASPGQARPQPAATGAPFTSGVHAWNTLRGGECVQPFTDAWAENFTVVACDTKHAAQLLARGTFSADADAAYPTAAELGTQITALCNAPSVIDYSAAAAVTDARLSFSYPPTKADWASGDRSYACFLTRSSGDPLTANLAATPAG